jgi:hypothetical protein
MVKPYSVITPHSSVFRTRIFLDLVITPESLKASYESLGVGIVRARENVSL